MGEGYICRRDIKEKTPRPYKGYDSYPENNGKSTDQRLAEWTARWASQINDVVPCGNVEMELISVARVALCTRQARYEQYIAVIDKRKDIFGLWSKQQHIKTLTIGTRLSGDIEITQKTDAHNFPGNETITDSVYQYVEDMMD